VARVPVSGTQARLDPHAAREFLSPYVYARFVERVTLLGGESSGKSTLARALAERFKTVSVDEYGRALWEAQQGQLAPADLLHIAQRQIEWEDAAAERANRLLFCDTSPLTTRLYSEWMFDRVDERLLVLARRPYAFTVLCAPDIPFHQDGSRRDADFRMAQHERYVRELASSGTPYLLARGSVEERVEAVARELMRRALAT
jgi:HTH-type transcriptional regulator, transcriptional repressor of NAD biosynthesis genes